MTKSYSNYNQKRIPDVITKKGWGEYPIVCQMGDGTVKIVGIYRIYMNQINDYKPLYHIFLYKSVSLWDKVLEDSENPYIHLYVSGGMGRNVYSRATDILDFMCNKNGNISGVAIVSYKRGKLTWISIKRGWKFMNCFLSDLDSFVMPLYVSVSIKRKDNE